MDSLPTLDSLAEHLGCSRESLRQWRNDPRYAPTMPPARDDNRYDPVAWEAWASAHRLGHRARAWEQSDAPLLPGFPAGSLNDWQKKQIAEKVRGLEIANRIKEGSLIVAAELAAPLGAALLAIQTTLQSFPDRVAPRLRAIGDPHEIARILREEIEVDQTVLGSAEYLTELPALAANLPSDAESERLFALVTFDGQDRSALNAIIAHVARLALAKIGARSVDAALERVSTGPEIPNVEDDAQ